MADEDRADIDVLITKIGEESYAFQVERTEAIIAYTEPTRAADASPHVLGMMDLRGRILPIVDLAPVLGIESSTTGGKTVVIEDEGGGIGFRVDGVREVATFAPGDLKPTPAALQASGAVSAVIQHDDTLVSLLDIDNVLSRVA